MAEPMAEVTEAESGVLGEDRQPISNREPPARSSPNGMDAIIITTVNHVVAEMLIGDLEEGAQHEDCRQQAQHREAAGDGATPLPLPAINTTATEDRARGSITKSDREERVVTQTIVSMLLVGTVAVGLGLINLLESRLSTSVTLIFIFCRKFTAKMNRKSQWKDLRQFNLIVTVFIVKGPKGQEG